MFISSQSSSLWTRLLIIPTRILLIITCQRANFYSRLIVIVYVIIFIGGLIVLLVRVASISYQEQRFYFLKFWVLLIRVLILPLLIFIKTETFTNSNQFTGWYENSGRLILIRVVILTTALLTLTKLIIAFKGIIRNL